MKEKETSKALHIGLWVAQGLLAAAFGMAGLMKLTTPIDQLAQKGMSFVRHYPPEMVRFIGVAEVLAALGLLLPSILRLLPKFTPLAATGLSIIMVLATQYHIAHNEPTITSIVFFILSVFVAWGRFKKAPIQPKS